MLLHIIKYKLSNIEIGESNFNSLNVCNKNVTNQRIESIFINIANALYFNNITVSVVMFALNYFSSRNIGYINVQRTTNRIGRLTAETSSKF